MLVRVDGQTEDAFPDAGAGGLGEIRDYPVEDPDISFESPVGYLVEVLDGYEELEKRGIEAVVKPRKNARSDTGPPARGVAVGQVRELGYGTWAELVDYGGRWAVETAYSTFKRLFGENAMGRSLGNIALELAGKVALYNMLANM